jgi:hypothetical protein
LGGRGGVRVRAWVIVYTKKINFGRKKKVKKVLGFVSVIKKYSVKD